MYGVHGNAAEKPDKSGNSALLRSNVRAEEVKEKYFVDEIKSALSPTISKERSIALGILTIRMAFVYLIYKVVLITLVEEHKSGVAENLSEKLTIVLANSS